MIKADISNAVAERLDLSGQKALTVVDATIDSIKDTIIKKGRLEIRHSGVFPVKQRKGRTGRNPKTLEEYPITPRKVVKFKISKKHLVDLDAEGLK